MPGLKRTGVTLVADNASAFNAALHDADQAVTKFGASATGASGKVSAAGQVITGALRQVGAIAVNALADAGRAFVGFVGDSIKKSGDFEHSMAEFGAVTGSALQDSGKSLKDFSDLFIRMGRELPVSTAEVQDAAISLAKGGIDPATIAAGALRTSLDLAAAGGVGLADSATILSKQLGVWVDSAANATEKSAFLEQTANLLSQAANVTTSDVADMAMGLSAVGGVAKVAGLSFEETVQSMALLAPSFSSASDAGTSFKTFLSRLQPTTNPATKAMRDLGLYTDETGSAFYDASGKFVGMTKASALLQTATAGLSESERLLAFQTIFGADAIRAAAIIADKGAAGYDAMGVSMAAAGTAAEQAKLRQVGFSTAMDNAMGSVEALQLTIGAALIPILTTLLNTYIAPGINAITAFADSFFAATDKVGFLKDSLAAFALSVGTWIMEQGPIWIAQVLAWGAAFISWIAPMIPGVLAALAAFALSIGTWIVAQAPSWGAQLLAWGIAFVEWVAPMIPPLLDALGTLISAGWAWVVDQAPGWLDQLLVWGKQFVAWVGPATAPLLTALGKLATDAWGWVVEQAPVLLAKLQAWGESFRNWVGPAIPPLLSELGALASRFISWVGEQAAPILSKLSTWATSMIAWIPGATTTFLAEWPDFLNQFLNWIAESAAPLLAKLGDWALQFIAWVVPMIPGFVVALGGIAVALLLFVAETAVTLLAKLYEWGTAFGTWIHDKAIPELVKAWPGFLENLKGLMDKANTAATAKANEIGAALVAGIKAGIANAWASFTGWIHSKMMEIPAAVRKALGISSPSRVMAELVGRPIVEGIAAGIQNGARVITATLKAVTSGLPQLVTPPRTQPLTDATGEAWDQVRAGIDDAVTGAQATVAVATDTMETTTRDTFLRLLTSSTDAWTKIHAVLTEQVAQAQSDVRSITDEMFVTMTTTFAQLLTESDRLWGLIRAGITDQIGLAKDAVKLATESMQSTTQTTWDTMGADATSGWDTIKTTIETLIGTTKDTVTTASAAMQEAMMITPTMQEDIFQTYRHVSDRMIDQLERIVVQIDNVTDAWNRLAHASAPSTPGAAPTSSDAPSGNPGQSAPPGGSRALGGMMNAQQPYLVGERRPEVVIPQVPSLVVPSVAQYQRTVSPPASMLQMMQRSQNVAAAAPNGPTFNLTAQYRSQTERSLMQDIKTLQRLYSSTN